MGKRKGGGGPVRSNPDAHFFTRAKKNILVHKCIFFLEIMPNTLYFSLLLYYFSHTAMENIRFRFSMVSLGGRESVGRVSSLMMETSWVNVHAR